MVLGLIDRLIKRVSEIDLIAHPIDLGLRLIEEAKSSAVQLAEQMALPEAIPDLAILLACSPIDAAIHDAFGRQHGISSFQIFSEEFLDGDLSRWLGEEYAGIRLEQQILPKPKTTLSLYHLVGALDPLSSGELSHRVNDGLPETLDEWIKTEGLTHLKVKLSGTDLDWDVGRMVEIDRIATASAPNKDWSFSLDFNECCPMKIM